jgi:hypothetical protein
VLLLLCCCCCVAAHQALLDRLERLNAQALDMDVQLLDKKIDQMMPELGFMPQVRWFVNGGGLALNGSRCLLPGSFFTPAVLVRWYSLMSVAAEHSAPACHVLVPASRHACWCLMTR